MKYSGSYNRNKIQRVVEKQYESRVDFPEMLLFVFFIFYYLLPSISVELNFMVALLLGNAYVLYLANKDSKYTKFAFQIIVLSAVFSLLYLVLTETSTISASASSYQLKRFFSKYNQIFMFFLPAIMVMRVLNTASSKQRNVLLAVSSVLFIYVVVNTTAELFENETAIRVWANFEAQNEEDIGTYAYIYSVPIIITVVVALFAKCQSAVSKVSVFAVVIALMLFLVIAQYTLALIIAFVGIVLQMSKNIQKQTSKLILWASLIVLTLFLANILDFLASVINLSQVSERLGEMSNFFGSGDATGYNLNGRLTLYGKTVLAFFESPIIGNKSLGFDGHATFLTIPADIGIFGAATYFSLVYLSKKHISELSSENNSAFATVFICLLFMGITNPIHGALPVPFAAWFIAPLIITAKGKTNETKLGNRRTRFNNLLYSKRHV